MTAGATNYPTSLDTATNLPPASALAQSKLSGSNEDYKHSNVHGVLSGAVIALETKIGAGLNLGRAMTLTVAASDASTAARTQADYVCDGVADDVQIEAAIEALSIATAGQVGGIVFLSAGTFYVTAHNPAGAPSRTTGLWVNSGVMLAGSGHSVTVVKMTNSQSQTVSETVGCHAGAIGIRDLTIDSNKANQVDNASLNTQCGLRIGDNTTASIVENVRSINAHGPAFRLEGSTRIITSNCYATGSTPGYLITKVTTSMTLCMLTACTAESNDTQGFATAGDIDTCSFVGCVARANGDEGFLLETTSGQTGELLVSGCMVVDNLDDGIGGIQTQGTVIVGNICRNNAGIGIEIADENAGGVGKGVVVVGNLVTGNGTTDGRTGIRIAGGTNHRITGNIVRNTQTGVAVGNDAGGATSGVDVVENTFETVGTAVSIEAGDSAYVGINRYSGVSTELSLVGTLEARTRPGVASGTATIANGSTSVVITHGLNTTPTLDDISVIFGEQGTNDYGRWWVSTITATQFTINVSADPGASGLDLAWRAVAL